MSTDCPMRKFWRTLLKPFGQNYVGVYAQISDCYVHMWYICYSYCIAENSLGAVMHLKTKTLRNIYPSSFLHLLQKVQVSG